jgi:flagellar motor switch protein FliN/FliY
MAETQTPEATEQQTTAQQSNKQTVQTAELSEAAGQPQGAAQSGIELLLDVTLPVTVTLGNAELPIQQVLQLSPGSVIRLDKSIDTPVEMYVKNSKFATGSVVVVNGKFGIRIKELFSVDSEGLAAGNK